MAISIDTSMYPKAPEQPNMLQQFGQIAGIRNAMLQNQALAARQAAGADIQASIGDDGTFDTNKFAGLIAHDPKAAFAAQESTEFAQAQRQAQIAEHTARVNLAMQQTNFMANSLGSMADKPGVSAKDVTGLAGTLVANGILDPKTAATELAQMPTDEAQLPTYLRGLQMRAMDSMQQLDAYHRNVLADNGAQIVTANTAPLGQQAPIEKQLSPGEAASPVAGPVSAEGAPTTVPLAQRQGMGVVATGLSPSQTAAQAVTGHESAQQGVDLQRSADAMPDVKAMLGTMSGDLSNFTSGPGAHNWKNLLAGMGRLGVPVDQNAVASQENFNKYATMLAQRQFQLLGGTGSDKQLGSAIDANPNDAISKLGNQRIIAMLKGNADAIATKNRLWQQWQEQHGAGSYGQFSTAFNKKFDPRVFQMQYLSPSERQQVMSGMNKDEQSQFRQQYNYASQAGWVK